MSQSMDKTEKGCYLVWGAPLLWHSVPSWQLGEKKQSWHVTWLNWNIFPTIMSPVVLQALISIRTASSRLVLVGSCVAWSETAFSTRAFKLDLSSRSRCCCWQFIICTRQRLTQQCLLFVQGTAADTHLLVKCVQELLGKTHMRTVAWEWVHDCKVCKT